VGTIGDKEFKEQTAYRAVEKQKLLDLLFAQNLLAPGPHFGPRRDDRHGRFTVLASG